MASSRVLALVIDYRPTGGEQSGAELLTRELAAAGGEHAAVTAVHVDNGSVAPVGLTAEQRARGVALLRLERNDGYASGIVAALQALDPDGTRFDYYWFLNSDLEIHPDCLRLLLARFTAPESERLAAVGPRVFSGKDRERVWGTRGVINPRWGTTAMVDWNSEAPLPQWSYIPGSSLLVRSAAYRAVGGLSTRYRMYYEETELCVELQKADWKLAVVPAAEAYHFHQSMAGRIPARHFAFYFARNNLYFWRKNFAISPWVQFPRLLAIVLKELILPLRRAPSVEVAFERMDVVLMGLCDSFFFLNTPVTFWERRLFLGEEPKGGVKRRLQDLDARFRALLPDLKEVTLGRLGAKTLVIYAHYDAQGKLAPYVRQALTAYAEELHCDVVLVSSSPRLEAEALGWLAARGVTVIQRRNRGLDFSSWKCAITRLGIPPDCRQLILTNDSVLGPFFPLTPAIEALRAKGADVWVSRAPGENRPHLQSYFLVFEEKALRSPAFKAFWESVLPFRSKHQIIQRYELGLKAYFEKAGLRTDAWLHGLRNLTLFSWDRLIETHRFPFLKRELLTQNRFASARVKDVPEILRQSGARNVPPELAGGTQT